MVTLTQDRYTDYREGDTFAHGVAAGQTIYAGSLVVLNAAGYAESATDSANKVTVGIAQNQVNNTGGVNDAITVTVRRGVFKLDNVTGANIVERTDIGDNCYIVDDQTVDTLATGSSVAGKIVQVDSDGVWVQII